MVAKQTGKRRVNRIASSTKMAKKTVSSQKLLTKPMLFGVGLAVVIFGYFGYIQTRNYLEKRDLETSISEEIDSRLNLYGDGVLESSEKYCTEGSSPKNTVAKPDCYIEGAIKLEKIEPDLFENKIANYNNPRDGAFVLRSGGEDKKLIYLRSFSIKNLTCFDKAEYNDISKRLTISSYCNL